MKQDSYNMPGIVRVEYLTPDQVPPSVMQKYIAGLPVGVFADGISMPLHGDATCQAVEEHSNNGRTEKVTLTFMTTGDVPQAGVVWKIKDANGGWWLIGAKERAYPTVKISTSTGEPGGDRAVKTVTVEHQSLKALVPLDF